jgi:predicted AlkP superfamily pyrophosphatase or phosphodiesterase
MNRGLCTLHGRPEPPLPFKKRLLIRWLRELSTTGLTLDVAAGLAPLYVDFVGYDEVAHPVGATHPAALAELFRIDASIRDIWRALQRVPQFPYDLFVLSDHGQTPSVPFEEASGGERG